uniref:G-protein coupled receptors family 1 profile domain-containing protein n=1 Tax=Colobus angolensis palliatus TaxID=336983 RepID=A0A2K5JUF5_COLAP
MTIMTTFNLSSFNPGAFILLGIPGLEQFHIWIGIPFFITYLVALTGNSVLPYLISVEQSLHEPMFFFLSILAATDLMLSNTCLPKTFSIFCFAMDSVILLAMAFDHYVAICFPLRYTTIVTHEIITKIVVSIISRSFCIIFPCVFLLKRLPFCKTFIIPNTYCEHIGIAQLACADISINIWFGFAVPIMTVISDLILTGISYTLILHAIFNLPSLDTRRKALSTSGSHICVILTFYTPAIFSVVAHRFDKIILLFFSKGNQ